MATKYFQQFINSEQLPGFSIIRQLQKTHGILQNRSEATIKAWVSNQKKKNKRLKLEPLKDISSKTSTEIKKRIKFFFKDKILSNNIPTVEECKEAREQNNFLKDFSPKKIQYLVIKAIQKTQLKK